MDGTHAAGAGTSTQRAGREMGHQGQHPQHEPRDNEQPYDEDGEPIFEPTSASAHPGRSIMRDGRARRDRPRRRITFADEHGERLEKVHFSEKLHYSAPDFSHDDHIVPCCAVV